VGVPLRRPSPLAAPDAPGAPTQTPHFRRRLFLPAAAPAFPRLWRRGSPALPARISIGQQVPDRPPAFPPLGLLQHLRPQNLLLHFPFRTHLEQVVSPLRGALAPPALGAWLPCRFLGPLVCLLVARNSFVHRTPPDLYGDTCSSPPSSRDVPLGLDCTFLPWPGLV